METTRGTIVLPTLSAAFIFDHELTGQFSDGMWENAAPHDHWKFWCDLEVKYEAGAEPKVVTTRGWECKKTAYNLASLYEIIGERMVALGRMGRAAQSIGFNFAKDKPGSTIRTASEYMPPTFEEWKKIATDTVEDRVQSFRNEVMRDIPEKLAHAFYSTKYEMKDLRADIKTIKTAMKTVQR